MSLLQTLLAQSRVGDILEKAIAGEKLELHDGEELMRNDDVHLIGLIANELRRKTVGDSCTFIRNIVLNYTNVCFVDCDFCAFYRHQDEKDAYTHPPEKIVKRVIQAKQTLDIKQVLIQGGVNPNLRIEYYEEVFRRMKEAAPDVAIHGLSAVELDFISRLERMSYKELLSRLKSAGLDSIPGAGAEILDDRVRHIISPLKINTDNWLRLMNDAHEVGIPSSATMMYGHLETLEERVKHLLAIRDQQEKSKGFMAFIAWNFEPGKTRLEQKGTAKYSSGGLELLRVLSVARILLNGYIDNIQSSWLTNGVSMAQLALSHGANDWGGTLFGEEVIPATGKEIGYLKINEIIDAIRRINRVPAERDNNYNIIRQYS